MKALEVFRSACPEGFLRDLSGGLVSAYLTADAEVRRIIRRKEEVSNTIPWVRRGLIEQMIRDVAGGYPEKITENVERGNFWFHTELLIGRIRLTQYASADPELLVMRPAIHRTELAKLNQQQLPFADLQTFNVPDRGDVYAVLIHGRDPAAFGRVGSALIRFPKPKIEDGFYDDKVDLMEDFPEIFAETHASAEEVIADTAIPELRLVDQGASQ